MADSRYEILQEVGRGGMGIVYKAMDRETSELVALKVLRPEVLDDKLMMQRFKNELRIARKITHKNVCRIYELTHIPEGPCISMEYVEGETIRSLLNRIGVFSLRSAVDVARQICSGLREAHAQGVAHRDLKPENLMMDRQGRVKIMDFGVPLDVSRPVVAGQHLGGVPFIAFEKNKGVNFSFCGVARLRSLLAKDTGGAPASRER